MATIELKTGDVVNTHSPFKWYKPQRWLSASIRFFEKLRFGESCWSSHTAMISVERDGVYVYEADPTVKKTLYSDWCQDKHVAIGRLPQFQSEVQYDMVSLFLRMRLNTKYDFVSLLIFQPIYILTGKWFGTSDVSRLYCSEYIAYVLNGMFDMYPEWYKMNPAKIYQDTMNFIIYKGEAKKLIKK